MKRFISLILFLSLVIGVSSCRSGVDAGEKKLAVIFPGTGYTKDRPLLRDSRKILDDEGYEVLCIEWEGYKTRYEQASGKLDNIDFDQYEDVIFVCKSIGTDVASTYVEKHDLKVRQIWYTPLQNAFDVCSADIEKGSIIAFIGTDDERSNVDRIRTKAEELEIELHVYDGCDHSLECDDDSKNAEILEDVMKITRDYVSVNLSQPFRSP